DECLGRIFDTGADVLVIADHGNCDKMFDDESDTRHTAHTTAQVPVVLVSDAFRNVSLADGVLADVAPTLLDIMGIPKPLEMTGKSLIRRV
ncbi:MAG: 2,3-bisphosphoglycerate-independent phosphoglycerate mutase, partial [Alphaproteobacteria bacterium]|nr:2,3-bisphosphoglycerate-independent phosphoglycerate mutase [Alphaproteobacteria bacterium]